MVTKGRTMWRRGPARNIITYSAAISACAAGQQCDRACELLGEMWRWGLEPDKITYGGALVSVTWAWKLLILNHIWLRLLFVCARHCALVSVTWVCLIGKLTDVGLFKSVI